MDCADDQALHEVQAFAGARQVVLAAPAQHVELVLVVPPQQLDHADRAGRARRLVLGAKQKRHLYREARLQRRVLVQAGEHLGRIGVFA